MGMNGFEKANNPKIEDFEILISYSQDFVDC